MDEAEAKIASFKRMWSGLNESVDGKHAITWDEHHKLLEDQKYLQEMASMMDAIKRKRSVATDLKMECYVWIELIFFLVVHSWCMASIAVARVYDEEAPYWTITFLIFGGVTCVNCGAGHYLKLIRYHDYSDNDSELRSQIFMAKIASLLWILHLILLGIMARPGSDAEMPIRWYIALFCSNVLFAAASIYNWAIARVRIENFRHSMDQRLSQLHRRGHRTSPASHSTITATATASSATSLVVVVPASTEVVISTE